MRFVLSACTRPTWRLPHCRTTPHKCQFPFFWRLYGYHVLTLHDAHNMIWPGLEMTLNLINEHKEIIISVITVSLTHHAVSPSGWTGLHRSTSGPPAAVGLNIPPHTGSFPLERLMKEKRPSNLKPELSALPQRFPELQDSLISLEEFQHEAGIDTTSISGWEDQPATVKKQRTPGRDFSTS